MKTLGLYIGFWKYLYVSKVYKYSEAASGGVLRPATLLKKRLCHRCFPLNFVKFLRTPFIEHLRKTASIFFLKDQSDFEVIQDVE